MSFMRRNPSLAGTTLRRRRVLLGAVTALFAGGCMSLEVQNRDVPELEDVFSNGPNLESSVGLTFRVFWGVTQGARTNATFPVRQFSALAEITTGTTESVFEVIQEPRVAYNNVDAGQWFGRKPWYDLYEVIATESDALRALDRGVRVGTVNATTPDGADTPRARVFSRFMLGISQIYLGIIYDSAFVSDEKTDFATYQYQLSPYKDVVAAGIANVEKAIADARLAPTNFTLPLEWINQQTITRDELIRIMNGYVLRGLVYQARTPAERAAVDWNRVITLTQAPNVITRDFGQQADQTKSGTTSAGLQYTQLSSDARMDNHLLGPADTSGAYQRWVALPNEQRNAFDVRTPDRRIHGAAGPTVRGKYFERLATQTMSTLRGTWPFSNYRGVRYGTNFYQTGFIPTMTLVEMDMLRAEAFLRTGRPADAIPLINRTRVTNGELPAIAATATTTVGTLPTCVPRTETGACASLLEAMLYEKRIELHAIEQILHWADWRAFGKLPRGSLIQLPVTGRELQTLGRPVYTYGGANPGSAP